MIKLDFQAAKEFMDKTPSCVILDVREEEEYITGHAAGALLLPVDLIDAHTARSAIAAKDTPVMVYCRTGRRSLEAAEHLEALGYTSVYDMGGLIGWPYGLSWD